MTAPNVILRRISVPGELVRGPCATTLDDGFLLYIYSSRRTTLRGDVRGGLDSHAWPMHDLCMATKTISIEIDAYELLVRERRDPKESFSRVIRRVLSERPALTAGALLAAMTRHSSGARKRSADEGMPGLRY